MDKRRISHISDLNFDAGAGIFAGLNVLPKTTYATDYSYKTCREMNERFIDALVERLPGWDRRRRPDFYLDFHANPIAASRPNWRNTGWPSGTRLPPA